MKRCICGYRYNSTSPNEGSLKVHEQGKFHQDFLNRPRTNDLANFFKPLNRSLPQPLEIDLSSEEEPIFQLGDSSEEEPEDDEDSADSFDLIL